MDSNRRNTALSPAQANVLGAGFWLGIAMQTGHKDRFNKACEMFNQAFGALSLAETKELYAFMESQMADVLATMKR